MTLSKSWKVGMTSERFTIRDRDIDTEMAWDTETERDTYKRASLKMLRNNGERNRLGWGGRVDKHTHSHKVC